MLFAGKIGGILPPPITGDTHGELHAEEDLSKGEGRRGIQNEDDQLAGGFFRKSWVAGIRRTWFGVSGLLLLVLIIKYGMGGVSWHERVHWSTRVFTHNLRKQFLT